MIFYDNHKKHKKTQEKNLTFSIFEDGVKNLDDSVAKPMQCKTFYNLSYVDGALKTGLGFRDLHVPASTSDLKNEHTFDMSEISEIDALWVDRWFNTAIDGYQYQLVFMDASLTLWTVPMIDEFEGYVWFKNSNRVKSFPLSHCNYRIDNVDSFILFTNEGMLYFASMEEGTYTSVPAIISSVVHYDNFFAITNTNRNTFLYSKNLNLKTWTESDSTEVEFMDNRGSFTKLVAFNDYVYLFREYGITKISIYTTKDDFSFTHLYISSSKIYEDSVCVCGDKIFFMTRDGLYTFNGNSVDKVAQDFDKYFQHLDNSHCTSACLNGKYYIATRCNFDDGESVGCESGDYVNNVVFSVDIFSFALDLYRGVDVRNLVAVDNPYMSKLCACFYGNNKAHLAELTFDGATFGENNLKCWKSFMTDLDHVGKLKKIKELIIETKYDVEVEIVSDEEVKTYKISGSEDVQHIQTCISGTKFQFIFKTDAQKCEIRKPMIVFDVVS